MIIETFPQLSDEWFAARCGLPSASNFKKILTTTGNKSKQSIAYMRQLAGERIIEKKEESFQNAAMRRGIELEPEARNFYEFRNDIEVQEIGMCYKNKRRLYSCSPDGLVEESGCIEIKCPSLAVHIGYLSDNKLPSDYFQQVQGQLFKIGRAHV